MCGIVGLIGDITSPRHSSVMRNMLFLDQVRGHHSTGVVSVTDKYVRMDKDLGGPTNLFYKESLIFDEDGDLVIHKGEEQQALIGHNRHATIGAINVENAHPFTFKSIYGVHNGTLRDYNELKLGKTFSSDSQYLMNAIATVGIEEVWKSFRGAAAIVYYDNKSETLNIIRNKERPMYITKPKWQELIVFSSEAWIGRASLARSKMEVDGDSVDLTPNTLYTFTVDKRKPELVNEQVLKEKPTANFWGGWTFYPAKKNVTADERKKLDEKLRESNKNWAVGSATSMDIPIDSTLIVTNKAWCTVENLMSYDGPNFLVCKVVGTDNYVNVYPTTMDQLERLALLVPHVSELRIKKHARKIAGRLNSYKIHVNHTRVVVKAPASNVVKIHPNTPPKPEIEKAYKGWGGFYALPFLEKQLDSLASPGCCDYCNYQWEQSDYDKIVWLAKDSAVCDVCAKDPAIADLIKMPAVSHPYH